MAITYDIHPSSALPLLVLFILLMGGCTLLLDFKECDVDDDCSTLAQPGEVLTCSSENYCVIAGEGPACTSEADCEDGEVCDPVNGCIAECVNSECAAANANWVCGRAGQCVLALTEECTRVTGPIAEDNIIIIGSSYPTDGARSSTGFPQENGVAMAVEEFNTAAPFAGGRRVVHIGCDDGGDKETGVVVAEHLANVVGVPAIIGPGFSSVYIEVVTKVTRDAGVLTMSGGATSALITNVEDDDLAWRAVASDALQSVAISKRVRDIQVEMGGTINVLAFGKDDAYGGGLLDAVGGSLASEESINLVGKRHPDPATGIGPEAIAAEGLGDMPSPDMVLLLGTAEIFEILDIVEAQVVPPPLYIFSDGGQLPELLLLTQADEDLRARVEGTVTSTEGENYGPYEFRYEATYADPPVRYSANAYDGTYLIMYAMVSLGQRESPKPITGENIRDVFLEGTFTTGSRLDAGPPNILEGRDLLQVGSTFDYEGASGPLDFDLSVGEAPSNTFRWVVLPGDAADTFGICGTFFASSGQWSGIVDPCPTD